LLAFLKRPAEEEIAVAKTKERESQERVVEPPRPVEPARSAPPIMREPRPGAVPRTPVVAEQASIEERELLHGFDRQRRSGRGKDDTDFVGGIKIS